MSPQADAAWPLRLLYWLPAVVWAGTLLFLAGVPGLSTESAYDFLVRKVGHFLSYSLLCYAVAFALRRPDGELPKPLILLLVLAVAVADEIIQWRTPARLGSWRDVLIDLSGAVVFLSSYARLIKSEGRRKPATTPPPSGRPR